MRRGREEQAEHEGFLVSGRIMTVGTCHRYTCPNPQNVESP